MKEFTVIRSFLAALKSSGKRFCVTALGCMLATAGALQAQSSDSVPQRLPASVQPTIGAPVTPAPAVPSLSIVDPMVKQASGCAGCGLSSGGGGCGYGGSNNG